jgi:aminoglycoside phosphotransferase (APT) family kinase protein
VEIRALVAPHVDVESVRLLGDGLDNVAYEVNGDLIVRCAKEPDPAQVDREARLLATIANVAPIPVPQPVFTIPEAGCLAYAKLPGRPLIDLPRDAWAASAPAIAATLGDFLAALHAMPIDAGLVEEDHQPLTDWRAEAAELYASLKDEVAAHRHAIEAFLGAAPPAESDQHVFSHNDLGIEHVLVDPATFAVTGVIDWTDAALVDPAYDHGLLYRDLGPAALPEGKLRERAIFYARCSVFEDFAYGLETGRTRYLEKSHAALHWLFGPR